MKSIRTSLLVPLLVGIVVLSTGAASVLYVSMRRALISQFDESLRAKTTALGSLMMIQPDGQLEFDYSDENYSEFRRHERPEYFQIRLADGSIVERSATLGGGDLLASERMPPSAREPHPVTLPDGRTGRAMTGSFVALNDMDDDTKATTRTQERASVTLPTVFVTVACDTQTIESTLSRLRTYLVMTVTLLVAAVALLVPFVIRRSLKPLHAIAEHAEQLNAESLNRPFPDRELPQELAPIARKLNDLLDRLAASFERESRFTASAAHELRTPVAEIRAVAEVALQWPELAQSQRALGDTVEVCTRMETLIDGLLRIARARAGQIAVRREEFDLRALVEQSLRPLRSAARDRELRISSIDGLPAVVWSDPALAGSIVANLVGNAVHHSPMHGSVLIDISQLGSSPVRLTITNECVGLSDDDLRLIREPFWTRCSSRSDQRHGLGLALVAEHARVLAIPLSLEVLEGMQFRATVTFPAGPRPQEPSPTAATRSAVPRQREALDTEPEKVS